MSQKSNGNFEDAPLFERLSDHVKKDIEDDKITTDVVDEVLANISGVESELDDPDLESLAEDEDLRQPFDPEKVTLVPQHLSLDVIVKRIRRGHINLTPEFQRMGGIWKATQRSQLIESLLLRIPLPPIYVDATNDDSWVVIDGLQRLTSLKHFILGIDEYGEKKPLKLIGLTVWKSYNNHTFEQLPQNARSRLEETQVTVYGFRPPTPPEAVFHIFRRINQGGQPLTSQEIRHALHQGRATKLLKELAESDEFKKATDNSVRPLRMDDRECVLRFLAFTLKRPEDYGPGSDLDSFLSGVMTELNAIAEGEANDLKNKFFRSMSRARELFSTEAFRKPNQNRRVPVSKALFEVWSVRLAEITDEQFSQLLRRKDDLVRRFADLGKEDKFERSITYSTGATANVRRRFAGIQEIIRQTLEEV